MGTASTAVPADAGADHRDPAACACGHRDHQHDPVGTRYCAATKEGSLARACICRVGQDAPARSYDRR